ncbi:MAG TPA: M50 family metallopeptidase [Isosphaeraceae bacterium]|nr:M50 family metallopeptidase [Isosphaeraceae bacterium]
MRRADQFVLIGSDVPLSWLVMMAVHEAGHVLGALVTGGTVKVVVLHPLKISCTVLSHNPHPLLVTWAGPVIGVLIPLAAFGVAAAIRMPGAHLLRFFAGFCLIANGAYIGVGSIERIYDADDLLRHGSQTRHLWFFGAVTIPLGLLLWHRLGPYFGLGKARGQVSRGAAIACLVLLVVVAGLEFVLGDE